MQNSSSFSSIGLMNRVAGRSRSDDEPRKREIYSVPALGGLWDFARLIYRQRTKEILHINLREVLPRVFADVISLYASVFLAFLTYFVGWVILRGEYPDPYQRRNLLSGIHFQNALTLVAIGIAVFALSGFYTHTRGYRGRFKLLTIFNAVSLTFLLQSFLDYVVLRLPLPRAIALVAWVLALGFVGGSRLVKGYVKRTYQIERKAMRGEKPIRNVLVIGGAGYIGSVLTRQLIDNGYRVRVLDELLFGDASIGALRGSPAFELLRADFRRVESVVGATQGMDAVIHLGAIVGDPACKLDSKMSLETNLAATSMIKHVCNGAGIRRLLFASTCSIYGASPYLLDERSAPAPLSLYACTKLDSERILLEHPAADYAPTILRLGTAFGWSFRPRFDLVVNSLTARAVCEHQLTIFNQTQWRPFIHVQDIARAFITCLRAPTSLVAYEIFNVGSDQLNSSLGGLAMMIKEQIRDVQVNYVENTDHRDYRVNFDKISRRLDFTCSHKLQDGIREIKRALESGLVEDYRDARYYNDRIFERVSGQATILDRSEQLVNASERFLRQTTAAVA
jgi:nucleoside-diphosphate-sugar epimerase